MLRPMQSLGVHGKRDGGGLNGAPSLRHVISDGGTEHSLQSVEPMKAWEEPHLRAAGTCAAPPASSQVGEFLRSLRGDDGCTAAALAAWAALCGLDLTSLWWSDAPLEERWQSRAVALATLAAAFAALLAGCTWSSCSGGKRHCRWARAAAHLVLGCGAVLWLMLHETGGRGTQAAVGVMALLVVTVLALLGSVFSGLIPARLMRLVPAALAGTARADSDDLLMDPGLVVIFDGQPTSSKGRWQPLFTIMDLHAQYGESVGPELTTASAMRVPDLRRHARTPSAQDTFSEMDRHSEAATFENLRKQSRAVTRLTSLNSAFSDVSHQVTTIPDRHASHGEGQEPPLMSPVSRRPTRGMTKMSMSSAMSDISQLQSIAGGGQGLMAQPLAQPLEPQPLLKVSGSLDEGDRTMNIDNLRSASRKSSRSLTLQRPTMGTQAGADGAGFAGYASESSQDSYGSLHEAPVTHLNTGDIHEITEAMHCAVRKLASESAPRRPSVVSETSLASLPETYPIMEDVADGPSPRSSSLRDVSNSRRMSRQLSPSGRAVSKVAEDPEAEELSQTDSDEPRLALEASPIRAWKGCSNASVTFTPE